MSMTEEIKGDRDRRELRCERFAPRSYRRQLPFSGRNSLPLTQFTRMNAVNLRWSAIFTKFSTRSPRDKVAFDPPRHYGVRMRKQMLDSSHIRPNRGTLGQVGSTQVSIHGPTKSGRPTWLGLQNRCFPGLSQHGKALYLSLLPSLFLSLSISPRQILADLRGELVRQRKRARARPAARFENIISPWCPVPRPSISSDPYFTLSRIIYADPIATCFVRRLDSLDFNFPVLFS